jgi:uncharacterized protein YycO
MTAVEWLVNEIAEKYNFRFATYYGQEIQQAKEMEKQQIIETWHNGYNNQSPMIDENNCGEQYYNENFKKD